jgi:beta-glucosidase
MWNVYLPPFHAGLQAGAGSIMSAYLDLNDEPASGNKWLLQEVLRKEWEFSGLVVSDAGAIGNLSTHGFASDERDAAFRALTSGVDMDMGSKAYSNNLEMLLQEGKITQTQLNDAVRPILVAKYRLGLFDRPYVDEARIESALHNPMHRAAARDAAERVAVLLRNEGNLLPLRLGDHKTIAVLGELADSPKDSLGPWTFTGDPSETVTVLAGLRGKVGQSASVEYAQGVQLKRTTPSIFDMLSSGIPAKPWSSDEEQAHFDDAVKLAGRSELVIFVAGEKSNMSGEMASRATLTLPGRQEELLQAVVKTGKPVVLILMTGRPLDLNWAAEHVPAILNIWYSGSETGTAVANLLFGEVAPSGRLPITWPRSAGQEPLYYAHNLTHVPADQNKRYWDIPSSPLFPFGYGLTYTSFEYSNLRATGSSVTDKNPVHGSVDVENTGDREGV